MHFAVSESLHSKNDASLSTAPHCKMEINVICFASDRSRLDLGEQEATSGASKDMELFLIWLQWQRALVMDSQWQL